MLYKFGTGEKSIVFLHGGATRYSAYSELIKELATQHTVYAFDLSGHGKSHTDGTLETAVIHAKNVLTNIEDTELLLIGHSFGGTIAIELAKIDERVKDVVVIDTFLGGKRLSKLRRFWGFLVSKNIRTIFFTPNAILFYLKVIRGNLQTILSQRWNIFKTAKLLLDTSAEVPMDFDSIKGNLHILYGEGDTLFPKITIPKNLLERVTFVPGDHDWLMGGPKKTAELIRKLI